MKSAQVKAKQVLFAHILLCAIFLAMVTFLNPGIIVRNDMCASRGVAFNLPHALQGSMS
jgi:hypothetical protein